MGSQCNSVVVLFIYLLTSTPWSLDDLSPGDVGHDSERDVSWGNRGETWPLSRQARPAHQGDRERLTVDCTVSNQRPRLGLLDCVTLQRTESELYICDSARFSFFVFKGYSRSLTQKKSKRLNYIMVGSRSFWCSFEVSDQKLDKCMFECRKQACFHVWTTCAADSVSAEPTRLLSAALSDLNPSFELFSWKSRNKWRIRPQWPLLTFSEEFITKYPPSTHTQTLSTYTHRTEQLPCRDCCRKCSISSSGKGSDIWPRGFGKSLCTSVCALLDVSVSHPTEAAAESTYLVAPLMFIMENISGFFF